MKYQTRVLTWVMVIVGWSCGCAGMRREALHGVAKNWCETIRASQVIPVYPLTEDLQPGDVFLVQTPIESQSEIYAKKGFLPLDDHRARLGTNNYDTIYFDSYFKRYGAPPFDRPSRQGGAIPNGETAALTLAPLPRAAFPTYNFKVSSSSGLELALPIKGVPIGLNYLNTRRATGTVTIADARTYANDENVLLTALKTWASDSVVQASLGETVRANGQNPVFLRVVSRVYLTGGVVVSLTRDEARGGGLRAGEAPNVDLIDAKTGQPDSNYEAVLTQLNKTADPVTQLAEAGGTVKFAAVSSSGVTLAESFDRLLVIGYLGFDVPVDMGGELGAPIPTFQRLEGRGRLPRTQAGKLTSSQANYKIQEHALEALVRRNYHAGLRVMIEVMQRIGAREFRNVAPKARAARARNDSAAAEQALRDFEAASREYVTLLGGVGNRYARYADAFATAYAKHGI